MKLLTVMLAALLPLAAEALEINDASRAQLEQLDGIGVATAQRILAERAKAPFAGWSDLQQRVKGLSARRVEQWQAQGVTVNSERGAFNAVAPQPAGGGKEQDR